MNLFLSSPVTAPLFRSTYRCLPALIALAALPAASHAEPLFNDTSPSADVWFYCLHEKIINPTLTGGENLRLVSDAYDNVGATRQQIFDNACVIRPFPAPVTLEVGQRLSISFRLGVQDASRFNAIMGIRSFGIRLIGPGEDLLPSKNTVFPGPVDTNDSDYLLATGTAYSVGCDLPLGNEKLTVNYPVNPGARGHVVSKKYFSGALNALREFDQPEQSLGIKWVKGLIKLHLDRLPDIEGGHVNYRLTIILHDQADAPVVTRSCRVTADHSRGFKLGSVFTQLAIGSNNATESQPGQNGSFIDFTLDDISASVGPTP